MAITIAHVRHQCTGYDALLRGEQVERFEARWRTTDEVWRVLRAWCPWDASNEVLGCFQATLVPLKQRGAEFGDDPMDLESGSELDFQDSMDAEPMDAD